MTPQLHDLEGIKKKKIACEFFRKPSQIKSILDSGKAATAADENGALNVWKDDDGFFRCTAMRRMMTIDEQRFSNLKDAKQWARKWLEEIK